MVDQQGCAYVACSNVGNQQRQVTGFGQMLTVPVCDVHANMIDTGQPIAIYFWGQQNA
jgi:hypothetical protein